MKLPEEISSNKKELLRKRKSTKTRIMNLALDTMKTSD